MKKLIFVLGAAAALVLAGCNQGGTSDQYNTSSGGASNSGNNTAPGGTNHSGMQPDMP